MRIQELEGTIIGKNRIISLLKDQATISLREICDLHQKLDNVETSQSKSLLHISTVAHPAQPGSPAHGPQLGTPVQDESQLGTLSPASQLDTPAHSPQLGTLTSPITQPGTVSNTKTIKPPAETVPVEHTDTLTHKLEPARTELEKVADLNDNLPPTQSSNLSTKSSPDDDEASESNSLHSVSFVSTPEYITHLDPETFFNNCHNMIEDLDMELPAPIYEPNFVHECPSPWLHYGYCYPCLEVARFRSSERLGFSGRFREAEL